MHSGNIALEAAFEIIMTIFPVILAVMVLMCLIRAIKGPRIADRIVAINMMGTMTMVIIAILAVKMDEGYLVDICIIYAMISFLAVTLLTKVYMGVYAERSAERKRRRRRTMTVLLWIRFIVGIALILCGIIVFGIELFGVFQFHYVLNRMHAAAMGDTLGIALSMLGLIILCGLNFTSLKMVLVVVFLWFASPVASHMLSRFEVATNEEFSRECDMSGMKQSADDADLQG